MTGRRRVLASLIGVGALAYGGAFGAGFLRACGTQAGGDLAWLEGIERIGRQLLAQGYAPRTRDHAAITAMARALSADACADFAAGRTVQVDGWVIAESEARLATSVADILAANPTADPRPDPNRTTALSS